MTSIYGALPGKEDNKKTVWLIDTTLRDGEQTPGISFSIREKIHIASLLAGAGISEIEVGIPAMGEREVRSIRVIAGQDLGPRLSCWCRACREDIDKASQCGVNAVHIAFPVSNIQMSAIGKSHRWILETLRSIVSYARSTFTYVSVGAQDASRADPDFLAEFVATAYDIRADRIRVADTVGILTPLKTMELISGVQRAAPNLCLEFHGHNDLGMATANTVTALEAGADGASVTVNGLGERAGNASLQEVAVALQLLDKRKLTLHLKDLMHLSRVVAEYTGIPVPLNKPILGRRVFTHESGIHVDGMLKNRQCFEAFPPELLGRNHEFTLGKHSGSHALEHILKQIGTPVNHIEARQLLPIIREIASLFKGRVPVSMAAYLVRQLQAFELPQSYDLVNRAEDQSDTVDLQRNG